MNILINIIYHKQTPFKTGLYLSFVTIIIGLKWMQVSMYNDLLIYNVNESRSIRNTYNHEKGIVHHLDAVTNCDIYERWFLVAFCFSFYPFFGMDVNKLVSGVFFITKLFPFGHELKGLFSIFIFMNLWTMRIDNVTCFTYTMRYCKYPNKYETYSLDQREQVSVFFFEQYTYCRYTEYIEYIIQALARETDVLFLVSTMQIHVYLNH